MRLYYYQFLFFNFVLLLQKYKQKLDKCEWTVGNERIFFASH